MGVVTVYDYLRAKNKLPEALMTDEEKKVKKSTKKKSKEEKVPDILKAAGILKI